MKVCAVVPFADRSTLNTVLCSGCEARVGTLATKTVSMSGTMSCSAPVVSMTITVVVSVIRVAPPMNAAAPTCTSSQPTQN